MKKNKQKNRRLKRYIRKQMNKKSKKLILDYSSYIQPLHKESKKITLSVRPNIDYPDVPPHPPGKLLLEE